MDFIKNNDDKNFTLFLAKKTSQEKNLDDSAILNEILQPSHKGKTQRLLLQSIIAFFTYKKQSRTVLRIHNNIENNLSEQKKNIRKKVKKSCKNSLFYIIKNADDHITTIENMFKNIPDSNIQEKLLLNNSVTKFIKKSKDLNPEDIFKKFPDVFQLCVNNITAIYQNFSFMKKYEKNTNFYTCFFKYYFKHDLSNFSSFEKKNNTEQLTRFIKNENYNENYKDFLIYLAKIATKKSNKTITINNEDLLNVIKTENFLAQTAFLENLLYFYAYTDQANEIFYIYNYLSKKPRLKKSISSKNFGKKRLSIYLEKYTNDTTTELQNHQTKRNSGLFIIDKNNNGKNQIENLSRKKQSKQTSSEWKRLQDLCRQTLSFMLTPPKNNQQEDNAKSKTFFILEKIVNETPKTPNMSQIQLILQSLNNIEIPDDAKVLINLMNLFQTQNQ